MKEQIIQLEAHDDANSARDKLGWVRAPRVLIVWPERHSSPLLERKLDLIILQRHATRRGAEIALITRDPLVKEHARELGIPVFQSIEASRRQSWRSRRSEAPLERPSASLPLSRELAQAGSRLLRPPVPVARRWRLPGWLAIAFTLGVLVLTFVLLPGASVEISPATTLIASSITVQANPNGAIIDASLNTIPARIIGVEVSGIERIAVTGIRQVPIAKATGVVIFTNLLPDQTTIPAGTIVRTSAAEPVRFQTLNAATLSGKVGDSIEVAVEAIEAGFSGNLPPNRINEVEGPLAARLGVTNPQSTRGGDTTPLPSVSEEDQQRLRTLLLQQLQQRAYFDMQRDPVIALGETEAVPVETLDAVLVRSEAFDALPGELRDTLGLEMTVVVQGVAFDQRAAGQLLYARLIEQIGQGYQIMPGTLRVDAITVQQVDESRILTLQVEGQVEVYQRVDSAALQRALAGRRVSRVALLAENLIELDAAPAIRTNLPFWPLMPVLSSRIDIQVPGR